MDHGRESQRAHVVHVYTTNMHKKSTDKHPWESHPMPIHLGETLVEFRQRLLQSLKPFYTQGNFDGIWEEASMKIVAIDSNGILLLNDADTAEHQNDGRKVHHQIQASNFQYHPNVSREHQTLQELGIRAHSHVYAFPTSSPRDGTTTTRLHFKFAPPSQQEMISIHVPSLFIPCILLKIVLLDKLVELHSDEGQQVSLISKNGATDDERMDVDNDTSGDDQDFNPVLKRIRLIFAGKQLEDYRRCVDYGMCQDATIFVVNTSP